MDQEAVLGAVGHQGAVGDHVRRQPRPLHVLVPDSHGLITG